MKAIQDTLIERWTAREGAYDLVKDNSDLYPDINLDAKVAGELEDVGGEVEEVTETRPLYDVRTCRLAKMLLTASA
jgi:hypothetical protein